MDGSPLSNILLILGVGFLVANLRVFFAYFRFRQLRGTTLLTWRNARPPLYGLLLAIGVVLGVLVFFKLVIQQRPLMQLFGEGMMFIYYAYAIQLNIRIGRGLYEDGIWVETGFVRYTEIGGLTWREGDPPTLIVIYRRRQLARRLVVPRLHYGEVRRLLRQKIATHDIHFTGKSLALGVHDERDDV